MAEPPQAKLSRCPLCGEEGARADVHAHLAEAHADAVETWTDAEDGRMHYRIECPVCGEPYEHRVKPRYRDPGFLEAFSREVALVAFDMLLNHVEASHAEPARPAEGEAERLPRFGPGGGSARPGQEGVPVPPGMEATEPPGVPGHPKPSPSVVQRPGRRPGKRPPGRFPDERGGSE